MTYRRTGLCNPGSTAGSGLSMAANLLDEQTASDLMARARQATANAYRPYSHFPVGAAVLLGNGEFITGSNVENASFGLTCCAERTACFTAAAAGHRRILAVAVTAPRVPSVSPCGPCRQVLNEFKPADRPMVVVLESQNGPLQITLEELLPRA